MLTIAPMTLPEVRQDWAWVRDGLLDVIAQCDERWLPEDAWLAVMSSSAFLWRIEVEGDDIGFLLLRRDMELDGPVLYIWAMWVEPHELVRRREDVIARLDEIAARVGAKRIRMESSRKGWLGFDYFKPRNTIFEREINHG